LLSTTDGRVVTVSVSNREGFGFGGFNDAGVRLKDRYHLLVISQGSLSVQFF
jgi:hypothetical protein